MRYTCVAAIVTFMGCGDDVVLQKHIDVEDAQLDSSSPDAASYDARETCTSFPYPGDPMCPAARPFCCPTSLELDAYCSATGTSTTNLMCREHPSDGLLMTCDSSTGAGCTVDQPICCSEQLSTQTFTYCTDHAYQGAGWSCSQ